MRPTFAPSLPVPNPKMAVCRFRDADVKLPLWGIHKKKEIRPQTNLFFLKRPLYYSATGASSATGAAAVLAGMVVKLLSTDTSVCIASLVTGR